MFKSSQHQSIMPGPAPPSASYLIKIVDSSDEEEEDEAPEEDVMGSLKRVERDMATLEESPTPAHPRSDSTASSTTSPPKKKKKKKNRNKNKKKKKTKAVVIDSDDEETPTTPSKSVSFDSVKVKSFERCLGTDAVPYDGGWPLGLGPALGDLESVPIDAYETSKQERLRIRALEKGVLKDIAGEDAVLETRQWDYKHKSKNPLFHLLQEEQRMDLLLEASTPDEDDDLTVASTHSNNSPSKKNSPSSPTKRNSSNSTSGSLTKRDRKGNNSKTKKRDSKNGRHAPGPSANTRSRSGSFSQQERYNEAYTQVDVHRVRNELEQLRIQRTGEGHTGCECRKLDVYLLPPNAGKKAHHRRMKLLRVKEELRKRHMLPSDDKTMTREELELLLHDAVEKEGCCSSQDCPCSRNGIGCQADVCSCWNDSHQTKEKGGKHHGDVEVKEIQSRCGNSNGMYATDLTSIHTMRQQILKQMADGKELICYPVVSPHTPAAMDDGGVVHMVVE